MAVISDPVASDIAATTVALGTSWPRCTRP
jgi:hypothetical protein